MAGLIQAAKDPIARNEVATKITVDVIIKYSSFIQNQIETAKIISEWSSDVAHSDSLSSTWEGISEVAAKLAQVTAGMNWYGSLLQTDKNMDMAMALRQGGADIATGVDST
ncbi:MAG TPA: hypothetical protein ACQGQH_00845 [Xylella sp.]